MVTASARKVAFSVVLYAAGAPFAVAQQQGGGSPAAAAAQDDDLDEPDAAASVLPDAAPAPFLAPLAPPPSDPGGKVGPVAPSASATAPGAEPPAAAPGVESQKAVLDSQEIHRWERHVRGFRREHNFALSAGVSSGTWHVKRLGPVANENFDESGVWTKFQYTYHLPIYRGFGYLLGSSAGYHYERSNPDRAFRPVPAYEFPGVVAGFVMNFSPVLRFSVAGDVYLERHNGIRAQSPCDPTKNPYNPATCGTGPEISVTMTAYDGGAFLDVFYDLNFALRIEAHRRRLEYQRPYIADDGNTYGVDAAFTKDDQWVGIGLVYHLL